MKKHKTNKYNLLRCAVLTGTLLFGVGGIKYIDSKSNEVIPYTSDDYKKNEEFESELEIIESEDIKFNNAEIENLLKVLTGKNILTREDLSKIEVLEIENELSNQDFSDLKYLKNLSTLSIKNNNIDLLDIQYNINLYNLNIVECKITNSYGIPNSVNNLILVNSSCNDDCFITPYDMKDFSLRNTILNNLTIKNPKGLEFITINTPSYFDLNTISECTNLQDISISRSPNIINPNVLIKFNNKNIVLDDYASIWLNIDLFNDLNLRNNVDNNRIKTEIEKLDKISSSLFEETDDEETKLQKITLYVINQIDYDETKTLDDNYNKYPMYFALNSNEGICINYSCLWQSLANRGNIKSYQLYNDNHVWNCINDEYIIDPTFIDQAAIIEAVVDGQLQLVNVIDAKSQDFIESNNANILYYYELDLDNIKDTIHDPINLKVELEDEYNKLLNIGYINPNTTIRLISNGKTKQLKIKYIMCTLLLMIMSLTAIDKIEKIKSVKEETFDVKL